VAFGVGAVGVGMDAGPFEIDVFEKLCRAKTSGLGDLKQQLQQPANEDDVTHHRKHQCQIV